MFNIHDKIKNIKLLRKSSAITKKALRFMFRFHKRDWNKVLHSPAVSLLNSYRAGSSNPGFINRSVVPGVTLYKDVLAYPLQPGIGKDYAGGLVNSESGLLINEAVHIGDKGQPSQELPAKVDLAHDIGLPQISQLVIFGGIFFNHFGHFMLESLGRLWAYDYYKQLDPYILFYNQSPNQDYLEKKNFAYQVFSGFDIPHKKILFINQIVKINNILIPEQKYGYTLRLHPDEIFLKSIRGFSLKATIPNQFLKADKVYVSRSKLNIGIPVGERYFEEYLQHEGYTILHPEKFTLFEQLLIYNNAASIIFCDGAAVHTCVLLPDLKANIAVIARRRDPRWDGRNIIDQFDGYHKYVLWIDAVQYQYQFGLESWHALSVLDWMDVSVKLKSENFVEVLCYVFSELDFASLIREELQRYLETIRYFPEYIDFMIPLKEPSPVPENGK